MDVAKERFTYSPLASLAPLDVLVPQLKLAEAFLGTDSTWPVTIQVFALALDDLVDVLSTQASTD